MAFQKTKGLGVIVSVTVSLDKAASEKRIGILEIESVVVQDKHGGEQECSELIDGAHYHHESEVKAAAATYLNVSQEIVRINV